MTLLDRCSYIVLRNRSHVWLFHEEIYIKYTASDKKGVRVLTEGIDRFFVFFYVEATFNSVDRKLLWLVLRTRIIALSLDCMNKFQAVSKSSGNEASCSAFEQKFGRDVLQLPNKLIASLTMQ